jgi:hypothetical protein
MQYTSLVYNLLPNVFWSITPGLPGGGGAGGAVGTRLPVGVPETIPDITFIARTLTALEMTDPAERARSNTYNTQATTYHTLFGPAPILIGSLEDVVNHFKDLTGTIGRIRIVSHGDSTGIWLPLFHNGIWEFGIDEDRLKAFQSSDEAGLRHMIIDNSTQSPTLTDSVDVIVTGLRAINSAVLTPFGLDTSGSPVAGPMQQFFEVINDLYQAQNGAVLALTPRIPPPDTTAPLSATQRTALTASLTLIEAAIRTRLIGTTVGTVTLTKPHLDALKTAVLGATPMDLSFFGAAQNLAADVLTKLATAMAASPRVEDDLRNAISGTTDERMFPNNTANILGALTRDKPLALTLGGVVVDGAAIQANADLLGFVLLCNDLFFLDHGQVRINGVPITPAQRSTLKNGLRAIGAIIAPRVVAGPGPITTAELTRLRDSVEALTDRQTLTNDWLAIDVRKLGDLQSANASLTVTATNIGFRAKLDHLRSIMRGTSIVDIRGCLIGQSTSFLDAFRDLLGTGANRPIVSAPDWFQSFPAGISYGGFGGAPGAILTAIDGIANNGSPPNIDDTDVSASLGTWQGLIDFAPHYAFISALFAAGAVPRFEFATLEWRVWRTGTMTTGIPILRMQAERLDDLAALSLGDVIERFRIIFGVDTGNAPSAAVRGQLSNLPGHLVTFKGIRQNVAAVTGPTDPAVAGFFTPLTTLAGQITGIGFTAPTSPLAPASSSLADIQASVARIQAYVDVVLSTSLDPFFTAVQGRLADPNAEIRYYYNSGLPLPLQSGLVPTTFRVTTFMSASTAAEQRDRVAAAVRSWMRIQWTGTTAQAGTMNTRITNVAIGTHAERLRATQYSMVSDDDPAAVPNSPAAVNPMPDFNAHIVKRPP